MTSASRRSPDSRSETPTSTGSCATPARCSTPSRRSAQSLPPTCSAGAARHARAHPEGPLVEGRRVADRGCSWSRRRHRPARGDVQADAEKVAGPTTAKHIAASRDLLRRVVDTASRLSCSTRPAPPDTRRRSPPRAGLRVAAHSGGAHERIDARLTRLDQAAPLRSRRRQSASSILIAEFSASALHCSCSAAQPCGPSDCSVRMLRS